jgi:DNA-binding NarL/FixJ family response regulator
VRAAHPPLRVLLVDDDAAFSELIACVLRLDGVDVLGHADNGAEGVELAIGLEPDVVVMDVRMRRVDGAEATRRLREHGDTPPVLVLTTFDDDETVAAALGAGAAGFLLKDAPGEDIVRAARAVAGGESWIDPQIAGRVLEAYRRSAARRGRAGAGRTAQLTEREREVLREVGRGATNAEAAAALHLGQATVKTHLGNILTKLDLRDRAAAIVLAHDEGLV